MNTNFELLFNLFDKIILEEETADLTPDHFSRTVAEEYILQVQKLGSIIPQISYQDLFEELTLEVIKIFRVKTYGFYDIKSYQKSAIHKLSESEL
ncbi:MAG: hypothetical protein AB8E15_13945 [Bdellovibrionales bacterium]